VRAVAEYVVFTKEGIVFGVNAQGILEAQSLAELFCDFMGLTLHSILESKPKERDGREP